MRWVAAPLLCLLAVGPVAAENRGEIRFDADLFPGLEWRNIGPLRGGRSLSCTGSPGRKNEYWFGAVQLPPKR